MAQIHAKRDLTCEIHFSPKKSQSPFDFHESAKNKNSWPTLRVNNVINHWVPNFHAIPRVCVSPAALHCPPDNMNPFSSLVMVSCACSLPEADKREIINSPEKPPSHGISMIKRRISSWQGKSTAHRRRRGKTIAGLNLNPKCGIPFQLHIILRRRSDPFFHPLLYLWVVADAMHEMTVYLSQCSRMSTH